jgi:hypothetical protein
MRVGEKQPFRITIEQYNQKVSVEVDHSDVGVDEVAVLLEQALLGAGWGEAHIAEIFGSNPHNDEL